MSAYLVTIRLMDDANNPVQHKLKAHNVMIAASDAIHKLNVLTADIQSIRVDQIKDRQLWID